MHCKRHIFCQGCRILFKWSVFSTFFLTPKTVKTEKLRDLVQKKHQVRTEEQQGLRQMFHEWQAGQELARCACNSENQWCPGLHQKKCGQQIKGGDSPSLLHCNETLPTAWLEGWNTSPVRKDWEDWGRAAWWREGSREILLQPFCT